MTISSLTRPTRRLHIHSPFLSYPCCIFLTPMKMTFVAATQPAGAASTGRMRHACFMVTSPVCDDRGLHIHSEPRITRPVPASGNAWIAAASGRPVAGTTS